LLEKTGPVTGKYPRSVATTWSLNFDQVERISTAAADLLRFSALLSPDKIPLELVIFGAPELGHALSKVLAKFEVDRLTLNEVLEPLTRYSLIRLNLEPEGLESQTYNIHRLMQLVLKEGMDEAIHHQWSERAVRAVNRAFPIAEFSKWRYCEQLLPHAQVCAALIEKENLKFPEATQLLNRTGNYLYERARFGEAEPLYKEALEICRAALGEDHTEFATSLNNLARLYAAMGRYGEAEPLYSHAAAIRRLILGENHPDFAQSLHNLAELYRYVGNYARAKPLYHRAVEIRGLTLGQGHPDLAQSLHGLAELYRAMGNYTAAEPLYRQALDIRRTSLVPQPS